MLLKQILRGSYSEDVTPYSRNNSRSGLIFTHYNRTNYYILRNMRSYFFL